MSAPSLETDAVVAEAVETLVRRFDPLCVVVFGSYARGAAGPDSDLDLLVVMPEAQASRATAIAMRRSLASLARPKDIVVTSPAAVEQRRHAPWHVVGRALAEGVEVYSRSGHGGV